MKREREDRDGGRDVLRKGGWGEGLTGESQRKGGERERDTEGGKDRGRDRGNVDGGRVAEEGRRRTEGG